jgi:HEAT repeat protein
MKKMISTWPWAVRAVAAVLVVTRMAGMARADQPIARASVQELRQILASFADGQEDASRRTQEVERICRTLSRPSELREALFLSEWRDTDADVSLAEADRGLRLEVARRLEQALMEALRRPEPLGQAAAAHLLSDMAAAVHATRPAGWNLKGFSLVLADLAKHSDGQVRQSAARALARIDPEPSAATAALALLLRDNDVVSRRLAAAALDELLTTKLQVTEANEVSDRRHPLAALVYFWRVVLPLVAEGLSDADPQVRQRCAGTLHSAGVFAVRLLAADRSSAIDNKDLCGLAEVLHGAATALSGMLNDSEPALRLEAHQTLEILARVGRAIDGSGRANPVRLVPVGASTPTGAEDARAAGGLVRGLRATLPSLAEGLRDPNPAVRRASLDALESIGEVAPSESVALIGALRDRDVFVRWAAARILGKLRAHQTDSAIAELARLLDDTDMGVRYAAAEALRQYGPAARSAAPALVQSIGRRDPATRTAAMRALQSMGVSAEVAMPALVAALKAPEAQVRAAAADFIGRFGPDARPAGQVLRVVLNDPDPHVRRAASDALLQIVDGTQDATPSRVAQAPVWRSAARLPTTLVAAAVGVRNREVIAVTPDLMRPSPDPALTQAAAWELADPDPTTPARRCRPCTTNGKTGGEPGS